MPDGEYGQLELDDPAGTGSTLTTAAASVGAGTFAGELQAGASPGIVTVRAKIVGEDVTGSAAIHVFGDPCEPAVTLSYQSLEYVSYETGSRTVSISVGAVVPEQCPAGVPDGTVVTLRVDDPSATGVHVEPVQATTTGGKAEVVLRGASASGEVTVTGAAQIGSGPVFDSAPLTVKVAPRFMVAEIRGIGGKFADLVVDQGLALVTGDDDRVVDLSDPERPIAYNPYPLGSSPPYWDALVGKIAFGRESGGYVVYDFADPTKLAKLATWTGLGTYAGDMRVVGTWAYALVRDGLAVVDVQDPVAPRLAGTVSLSGSKLAVDAPYVYVLSGTTDLSIVDVADSTQPKLVTTIQVPGVASIADFVASRGRLYVAGHGGVSVLSVADPANPIQVGNASILPTSYNVWGLRLAVDSQRLYVYYTTDFAPELAWIDLASIDTKPSGKRQGLPGGAGGLASYGSLLYLTLDRSDNVAFWALDPSGFANSF